MHTHVVTHRVDNKIVHLYYITFDVKAKDRNYYREVTSWNAWRRWYLKISQSKNRKPTDPQMGEFHADFEQYFNTSQQSFIKVMFRFSADREMPKSEYHGVPTTRLTSVFDFYKLIGWDYKAKKYIPIDINMEKDDETEETKEAPKSDC